MYASHSAPEDRIITGILLSFFLADDGRWAIFTQDIVAFCIQSRRRRPPRSKPKTNFLRPKSSSASKNSQKWTNFLWKYVHLRPSTNATQEFDDANPIHIHVISDQSDNKIYIQSKWFEWKCIRHWIDISCTRRGKFYRSHIPISPDGPRDPPC